MKKTAQENIELGTTIKSDGYKSYGVLKKSGYEHTPIVVKGQDAAEVLHWNQLSKIAMNHIEKVATSRDTYQYERLIDLYATDFYRLRDFKFYKENIQSLNDI